MTERNDRRLEVLAVSEVLADSGRWRLAIDHGPIEAGGSSDGPTGCHERVFAWDAAEVGAARRWVAGLLPDGCASGDAFLVVASELMTNCLVHGRPGGMTLVVSHLDGGVLGLLAHAHGAGVGACAEIDRATVAEITGLTQGLPVKAGDLRGSGRGLVLVAALCEGHVDFFDYDDVSVVRWLMPGCGCGGSL